MTNANTQFAALLRPTKALHTHDCECCRLVANLYSAEHTHHDVYTCEGGNSLVIRHGSDGPDYSSFPLEIARLVAAQDSMWAAAVQALDDSPA